MSSSSSARRQVYVCKRQDEVGLFCVNGNGWAGLVLGLVLGFVASSGTLLECEHELELCVSVGVGVGVDVVLLVFHRVCACSVVCALTGASHFILTGTQTVPDGHGVLAYN